MARLNHLFKLIKAHRGVFVILTQLHHSYIPAHTYLVRHTLSHETLTHKTPKQLSIRHITINHHRYDVDGGRICDCMCVWGRCGAVAAGSVTVGSVAASSSIRHKWGGGHRICGGRICNLVLLVNCCDFLCQMMN